MAAKDVFLGGETRVKQVRVQIEKPRLTTIAKNTKSALQNSLTTWP
jgi:hypothetical protein